MLSKIEIRQLQLQKYIYSRIILLIQQRVSQFL